MIGVLDPETGARLFARAYLRVMGELRVAGGEGSGNFGHEGRPGEVGGSGAGGSSLDTPSMHPDLAEQSKTGIAAVERLLPEAVRTADYSKEDEPTEWDEVPKEAQDEVYSHFTEDASDNINIDTSSLDDEIKSDLRDKNDEIIAATEKDTLEILAEKFKETDAILPIGTSEQIAADAAAAIDPFKERPLDEDQFHLVHTLDHETLVVGDDNGDGAHLELDELRFKNGDELTDEQKAIVESTWDGRYETQFNLAADAAMQTDSYYESRNEIEQQQIEEEWQNLSDSKKLQMYQELGYDSKTGSTLSPGEPHVWRTGMDNELPSEDYNRTRSIANRLVELRTDELRQERGLLGPMSYTIEDKSMGNRANFVVYDENHHAVSASNTMEMAKSNAEEWVKEGRSQAHTPSDELIADTWTEWKRSSSSQMGQALQLASARELDGVHRLSPEEVKLVDSDIGKRGMENMQAYARAQWETSQYVMAKAGQEDVKVYRALMLPGSDLKNTAQQLIDRTGLPHTEYTAPPNAYRKLPEIQLQRAGAQSTTGTLSVANGWAGVGKMPLAPERVVVRIAAPRTSVLSLPVFGKNEQEEHEAVLLGSKDKWAWDAWRGHAPSFTTLPITKALKAAMRMLRARLLIDLQAIDRGQPHWLSNMPDAVVIRARERRLKTLGGEGSGNFGHSGRPGEVGGSGEGHSHAPVPDNVLKAIDQPDGGFTYHAVTGAQPTTGFALSIHKDREQVMDSSKATVDALAEYADKNWDLVSQDNNYLGGWHNPEDGKVYLDVSTVVKDAATAERMCREAHQLAYFDLEKGVSIKIKYGGQHVGKSLAQSHRSFARRANPRRLDRPRSQADRPRADRGRDRAGASDPRPAQPRRLESVVSFLQYIAPKLRLAGGVGSGNFGHAGRPGEVGGSSSDGMSATERFNQTNRETNKLAEQLSKAEIDRNTLEAKLMFDLKAEHPEITENMARLSDRVMTNPELIQANEFLNQLADQYSDHLLKLKTDETAMKVEKVTNRAGAIAEQMGVDPSMIHVVDKEPTSFVVGGQEFKEAGHYDPRDGQIEINARNSYDDRMSVTNGIVAHEISHAMYDEVSKAQSAEHTKIEALPAAEKHRLFVADDWSEGEIFIRGAKIEALPELKEKFPASAAFATTWGDNYLTASAQDGRTGKGIVEDQRQKLINENGHSVYARSYWTEAALNQSGTYHRALTETMAEVTRYLVQPSSWHETSQPTPKSPWIELQKNVRDAYSKLKARP